MTFALADADVEQVFAAFGSAGDAGFRVRRRPARSVLHFYLEPTGPRATTRLRVRRRRSVLRTSLETKQVVHEETWRVHKTERTCVDHMPPAQAAALLCDADPVVSAFIKDQHRMALESPAGTLKASLDRILPFRADRPETTGPPFWHVEVEETGAWPLADFLGSAFVRHELTALRPLLRSKWEAARLGPPCAVPDAARDDIGAYFSALLDRGERALRPQWRAA